jgi:cyclase
VRNRRAPWSGFSRAVGVCAALTVCLVARAAAQTDVARMSASGQDVRKTVIADGIYQFTTMRDSYVRQLNSVVIVNDQDVVVFDTDTRPSSARIVLAAIRAMTSKPVRYVVNSHWHPDHWSGNQVYAEAFPGVSIIATEETRQTMVDVANEFPARFRAELARMRSALEKETRTGKQEDGTVSTPEQRRQEEADLRDYESFVMEQAGRRPVFPTTTYVERLTLFDGGREMRFLSVTGDAPGTTVLYLPHEKVLITGDVVSYPIPYVSPPPTRHLASLRALAALDVDVIVPGHGPAFRDKAFLNLEAQLLDTVIEGVHGSLQKGMLSLDEIQQAVTAEGLREQFSHGDADLDARFRARVQALVKLAVREARGGQDFP